MIDKTQGKKGPELQNVEDEWIKNAGLKLYSVAVADALVAIQKIDLAQEWCNQSASMSHFDAKALATSLGVSIYWDWDAPRTRVIKCHIYLLINSNLR